MSRVGPFTFYEFFAGGGMARVGLGEAWRCVFANDFDPVKVAAYRANFGDDHLHAGDVWALSASDLPGQADLAWASSPCQDFSLAGARAGLKGGRSSAFFGFWKLIEALNEESRAPRTIVVENVIGLLTSHGGADFQALCEALKGQGYRYGAVEIDAQRFVPQSRPRVFVIATKCEVVPALYQVEPTLPFHGRKVVAAFEQLPPHLQEGWIWWHLPFPVGHNETIAAVLEPDNSSTWLSDEKTKLLLGRLNARHTEKLKSAKKRRERTVGTLFRRMRLEDGEKVQRAEIRFDGFAGCLRTPGGGSSKQFVVVVEGDEVKVRMLTGREAARLMGLDDSYELPTRESAALALAGDGVVVDVVSFLGQHILEPLSRHWSGENGASKKGRR